MKDDDIEIPDADRVYKVGFEMVNAPCSDDELKTIISRLCLLYTSQKELETKIRQRHETMEAAVQTACLLYTSMEVTAYGKKQKREQ